MGEPRTLPAAAAFAAAALCLAQAVAAQAVSPKRDASPKATGAIVQFEESAGVGIVYHEQAGGLAGSVTAPVKSKGGDEVAAASPAPTTPPAAPRAAAREVPSLAAGRVAQRRVTPPADAKP